MRTQNVFDKNVLNRKCIKPALSSHVPYTKSFRIILCKIRPAKLCQSLDIIRCPIICLPGFHKVEDNQTKYHNIVANIFTRYLQWKIVVNMAVVVYQPTSSSFSHFIIVIAATPQQYSHNCRNKADTNAPNAFCRYGRRVVGTSRCCVRFSMRQFERYFTSIFSYNLKINVSFAHSCRCPTQRKFAQVPHPIPFAHFCDVKHLSRSSGGGFFHTDTCS